jgi:hypothetical protein
MHVLPARPLYQRALNRGLRRFGINPFPVRFESSLPQAGGDHDSVFNAIYAHNYWDCDESKSGGGSTAEATARYIPQLVQAIEDLDVTSLFDAPCGDLNWMHQVIGQTGVGYVGGDIAEEAIATAKRRCPDLDIRRFDICRDPYPDLDLWHCRDTFFHLSFADIRLALDQAKASKIRLVALTTNRALWLKNVDIRTGGFRLLDLERPPFNFPRAIAYLRDYRAGEFPRFVGIWRREDIP